jgi:hypothetical protein
MTILLWLASIACSTPFSDSLRTSSNMLTAVPSSTPEPTRTGTPTATAPDTPTVTQLPTATVTIAVAQANGSILMKNPDTGYQFTLSQGWEITARYTAEYSYDAAGSPWPRILRLSHGTLSHSTEITLELVLLQHAQSAGEKGLILQQGIATNGYGTRLAL